jgi:hypothetical protein
VLQQAGNMGEHRLAVMPQPHHMASAQNPPFVPPVNMRQHPEAQSLFCLQVI